MALRGRHSTAATYYNLLAVDSTNVYFNPYDILATVGYGGNGSVLWAIPKGAGPAPQTGGTAMCYSGWSSNGNATCPSTQYGGTLLTTGGLNDDKNKYVGTDSLCGLISTGSEVCWVDGDGTELRCVPVAGGDPVTLVKVLPDFYQAPIATDGTNVFYRYTDGTLVGMLTSVDIMSVPIAGGTPVKVGSYGANGDIGGFFLVNAGYLYWAPTTATGQDTIMKMSTTGGTPVVLASNQTVFRSTYAATDGKDLYWWGHDTDGLRQIMKVSVNGGAPTVVVKDGTENINVLSVVVDDTNVYWMHPPYMYKCPK
jgi:CBS domain-containing protein